MAKPRGFFSFKSFDLAFFSWFGWFSCFFMLGYKYSNLFYLFILLARWMRQFGIHLGASNICLRIFVNIYIGFALLHCYKKVVSFKKCPSTEVHICQRFLQFSKHFWYKRWPRWLSDLSSQNVLWSLKEKVTRY